jgi:hypothetical protein
MKKLIVFAACLVLACIPRRTPQTLPTPRLPTFGFMQLQSLELDNDEDVNRFQQPRLFSPPENSPALDSR